MNSLRPSLIDYLGHIISQIKSAIWPRGQNLTMLKFSDLLKNVYNSENTRLENEDNNVSKYLKDWKKLSFKNSILYRTTMTDGQQVTQLVLPVHFRSVVLKRLHFDSGHQGPDRTTSLLRYRFFWLGLDSDVEKKVKSCERCVRRKSNAGPSAELINIVSTQPI